MSWPGGVDPRLGHFLSDVHPSCLGSACGAPAAFVGFTGGLGSVLLSKTPQPETRDSLPTPSQGSGPRPGPVAAANCGSCLRRNVISERERR